MKELWKGVFNFKCELKREYAFAYSPDQAKVVMARRIAKKQGVLPVVVLGYLKDHPNSYEIKIETKFEEVEDEKR